MQMDMMHLWGEMGWFAKGIVYTLALMSAFSTAILISKWWTMRRAQAETRKFAPEFSQFLEEDNLNEAIKLAEGYKKSHVARVLGGALSEIRPLIADGSVTVADINSAERAVEREMLMTVVDLKRGLGVLATVGATAPFVGLLGTTMGIVNSFTGMSEEGGGLEAISAGVAEALIATAVGLIVAIPAVWLYNYLTGRMESLFAELAYAGREMVDWMMKREALRGTAGSPLALNPASGD